MLALSKMKITLCHYHFFPEARIFLFSLAMTNATSSMDERHSRGDGETFHFLSFH